MKTHDRKLTPEFLEALSAFQAEVEAPSKNARNPHFQSAYADLSEVLRVTRPALAKHGLALTQMVETSHGEIDPETGEVANSPGTYLRTLLTHRSGGYLESVCEIPVLPGRNGVVNPQQVGSAITYFRRYQVLAVCGIAAEDDDANSAAIGGSAAPARSSQPALRGNGNGPSQQAQQAQQDTVPEDLARRIRSIDAPEKLDAARRWLESGDSGLSEMARSKALKLLEDQEKRLSSQDKAS